MRSTCTTTGPATPSPAGDLDLGALDHGGPNLGELDHGALDAGLNASLDPGEHDPLSADPLTDPLAEHDPVPAEPDWIYDPALVPAHPAWTRRLTTCRGPKRPVSGTRPCRCPRSSAGTRSAS